MQQYAEWPPIDVLVVALMLKNFGRHVLWSSTERECQTTVANFAKSEIGEFDMPLRIDKYVFGLDVAIDNTETVKLLKSNYQFRSVKSNGVLGECSIFAKLLLGIICNVRQ